MYWCVVVCMYVGRVHVLVCVCVCVCSLYVEDGEEHSVVCMYVSMYVCMDTIYFM